MDTVTNIERFRAMCLKFKRLPNKEYLNQAWLHITKELKVTHDEQLILFVAIPSEFKAFPSIIELEKLVKLIRDNSKKSKPKPILHYTNPPPPRVEGTPALWEALFLWIERNQTEHGAFKVAYRRAKTNDDELWQAYKEWATGRLPSILKGKTNE